MSMRFPVFFTALVGGLASIGASLGAADAQAFTPAMSAIGRYAAIWKRSPFIVETVAVQVSAGLSAKYSLVGIVSLAGQPAVFLVDKNNGDPMKNRMMVMKGQPSPTGVELVSVDLENDPRKSTAVIQQAGQQATLSFDSSAMGPTGPGGPPAGVVPPVPTAMMPQPAPGMSRSNSPQRPMPGNVNAYPAAGTTPPPSPRRIIRPAPINLSN